ncbi:MAG: LysR family transcriptional regulator [Clostridia bacterium]|nr:LysR family transcriptional regulator [Clostridia bacterium]
MIDLDLYKVFYTVAKCGSLSKAAEELYVSQPAVSQSIKQLEKLLDTPLFNRLRHGMELSAQGGKIIYDDVEQAVKLLEGAERKLGALKQDATGSLRIGASETIFQYVLSEKIVEYNRLYPHVKIELISDVSPKIIALMKSDACDIGFLNLPVSKDEDIEIMRSVRLLSDIFIAGRRFEFLCGESLSVKDLTKYPLLLMEEKTVSREAVNHYGISHGVYFKPAVEVNSWGFMKRLVADGMGIGCIPREYALSKIADGSLFEVDVRPSMPARSVGMALPKNVNMTFALQSFINLFDESV